jgi:hypothetical protein
MTKIETLVSRISKEADCTLYSKSSTVALPADRHLPDDLCEFFDLSSGCHLFEKSQYGLKISAENFVRANDFIPGRISNDIQLVLESALPMTWEWYLLGEGPDLQFVVMDLHPARLGFCYDAFHDLYPNHCELVATSFGEFLEKWIDNKADELYWTKSGNKLKSAKDLL